MASGQEIQAEKERLYESASLRDDLNDPEAEVLLKWGETAVERMAQLFASDLEQKARFLRQLIKNINRFVGQREFNDLEGQKQYLGKVLMYLPQLGWEGITEEMLFGQMPQDSKDMMGTLRAILNTLTPPVTTPGGSGVLTAGFGDESGPPASAAPSAMPAEPAEPVVSATTPPDQPPAPGKVTASGTNQPAPLENHGWRSINQVEEDHTPEESEPYGEEDDQ